MEKEHGHHVPGVGSTSTGGGSNGVALMILDDQRSHLPKWADTVMADPDAAKYVSGVGIHWYASVDDTFDFFPNVAKTAASLAPSGRFVLGTEACNGFLPWSQGPQLGSWRRGGLYMKDILGDLNSGAGGWTDWNIALDMKGGPNWAGNVVDAPILVDADAGVFYKQPMYYALAHFSRFLPPGSVRVGLSLAGKTGGLTTTAVAFVTPEKRYVLVVANHDWFEDYEFEVEHPTQPGAGSIKLTVPKGSWQTIVI